MFEDGENDSPSDLENQTGEDQEFFSGSPGLLEEYFTNRLSQIMQFSDLSTESISNYQVKILKKMGGISQGMFDVVYSEGENGRRFRTRVDVVQSVRKESRKSREQYFLSAQEHREKILLTQLMQNLGGPLSLRYENDVFLSDHGRDDIFFTYGNVSILNWGVVISNPDFHTQSQVFPVGFRCLRQERDEFMDELVDCLCEVDAFCVVDGSRQVLSELNSEDQKRMVRDESSQLVPLFRISVCWRNRYGEEEIKVYEGKTPQVVWQGAMLEGLHQMKNQIESSHASDESEHNLRESVREARRLYFRTMRQEQGKGNIEAVRPRIVVDSADSFFDVNILKLVEGMHGVLDCKNYVFLEIRNGDHFTKQLCSDFAELLQKMKFLDSVARKGVEMAVLESKKRKREEFEKLNERNTALIEMLQNRKVDIVRRVKKAKEEVMTHLENIVRMEQSLIASQITSNLSNDRNRELQNDSARPYPREGKVQIEGSIFGKLLELREFLKSLQKLGFTISRIPTIEEFIENYTKSYFISGNEKESSRFWEKLAVELTSVLYPEFERVMGLDVVSAQLGDFKLSVNEGTWKEILRMIIYSRMCKNMKIGDLELSSILKGRGYFTSPESADRKALKLIKKRLFYAHSVRHELQETVVSVENGLYCVVQIPRKGRFIDRVNELFILCVNCRELNYSNFVDLLESHVILFEQEYYDVDTTLISELKLILQMYQASKINESTAKDKVIEVLTPFVKNVSKRDYSKARDYSDGRKLNGLRKIGTRVNGEVLSVEFLPSSSRLSDEGFTASFCGELLGLDQIDSILSSLPVLLQRCFTVLFEITQHPLIDSVSIDADLKSYLGFSQSQITFQLVQRKLLSGEYGTSVSRFYEDMNLVFESLLAFFPELSPQKQAVFKLNTIFERLFYEMVITCECPLPFYGSCQVCRTTEPPAPNTFAVCDRCDGTFHLNCLEPPFELSATPRSEWYCPFCVESKGVSSAHPNRFSIVRHPTRNCEGNVVGIETVQGQLVFVVDFISFREKWNADDVRKNAVTTDDGSYEFDFADYNQACALCSGYSGWGGSLLVLPPILNPLISQESKTLSESDTIHKALGNCLIVLWFNQELNSDTWLELFETLREIIFSVYSCQEMLPASNIQEEICSIVSNAIQSDSDLQHEDETPSEQQDDRAVENVGGPDSTDHDKSPFNLQGREDALLYRFVFREILCEQDAEIALEEFLTLPDGISTIITKGLGLLGKASDAISEEWLNGWDTELSNFSTDGSAYCCLCGKTDLELCSPLVSFLDLNEWVTKYGISIYKQGFISREMHHSLTKNLTFETKDSKGISVAHTCCAEFLNLRRASLVIARKHADNQALLERVCRIGSPLTTPIGIDRNGCLYWIFDSPFKLYVGRPNSQDNLCEKFVNFDWFMYEHEDLPVLYTWLSEKYPCELSLKRLFRILFPDAVGARFKMVWPEFTKQQLTEAVEDSVPATITSWSTERIVKLLTNTSHKLAPTDLAYVLIKDNLWLGEVLEITKTTNSKTWIKVSFEDWDDECTNWFSEKNVIPKDFRIIFGTEDISVKRVSKILRERHFMNTVSSAPPPLNNLLAVNYLRAERRASSQLGYGFTNCWTGDLLSILKMAMLVIESSLPIGAIDESEERWCNNFREVWRESVNVSSDAISLMQCQLMLEFGIRTAWLKPNGLKFFSCLPSRIHALRNASFGAVALRIWALDLTIKYEKVEEISGSGSKKTKSGK